MIVTGVDAAFYDVRDWSFRLATLERQTCLIETTEGDPLATGFLVGPDILMTVAHALIHPARDLSTSPERVRARFDYGRTEASGVAAEGRMVQFAATDWILGCAPPPRNTNDGSVDTAVLRLAESLGDEEENPRGWVPLTPQRINLQRGDGLAIIGHPEGGPLKMSMNTQSVIGYDEDTGHLMYRTDTLPGSSGAPCFDLHWHFVAMHQSRSVRHGNHNRGIPISAIFDWLQRENLWDEVSKTPPEVVAALSPAVGTVPTTAATSKRFGLPLYLKQAMKEEGEGQLLEYKESWANAKSKCLKTIAAFMNSKQGGTLLLGVNDKGKPVGIEKEYAQVNKQKANWDGFSLALTDSLDQLDSAGNALQDIRVQQFTEEEKTICIVTVEPSDRPVFLDNKFYQRIGNQSRLVEGHKLLDYVVKRWSWLGSATE